MIPTLGLFEIVPRYCSNAIAATAWAEPLIAASNLAFLLTAVACANDLRQQQRGPLRAAFWLLIAEVVLIGAASLLFHTFQTRWSRALDMLAIGLFMLTYMLVAVRGLLGFPARSAVAAVAMFVAACIGASLLRCNGERCLSGTLSYAPALIALTAVGFSLRKRSKTTGNDVLSAAALLSVALLMRSTSFPLCEQPGMADVAAGTLVAWLLIIALMLWFLLRASIALSIPRTPP
jgi:hypothetical protein